MLHIAYTPLGGLLKPQARKGNVLYNGSGHSAGCSQVHVFTGAMAALLMGYW